MTPGAGGVYWPQISDPFLLAIWSESFFNWLHLGRRIFPEEAIQNVHLFLEHWIWTRHKIKLQLLCSKQPHKDWYAPNKTWCCNSFHYFILAHSREEISSYFHSKNSIICYIECLICLMILSFSKDLFCPEDMRANKGEDCKVIFDRTKNHSLWTTSGLFEFLKIWLNLTLSIHQGCTCDVFYWKRNSVNALVSVILVDFLLEFT